MRGVIFSKLKREDSLDNAIEAYTRCLELDHHEAEVYHARAACWFFKGEHELALADASRAIESILAEGDTGTVRPETQAATSHFNLALTSGDFHALRADIHDR